jgi:hypothetical protein
MRASFRAIGPLLAIGLMAYAPGDQDLSLGRAPAALPPELQPDGKVTLASADGYTNGRRALIQYVWGPQGVPTAKNPVLKQDVPSCNGRIADDCNPLGPLRNLARVDNLIIRMESGESSIAHHFIAATSNNRLVIVQQGHDCSLDFASRGPDHGGLVHLIDQLLANGFSVLGMYMPRLDPIVCREGIDADGFSVHDRMFRTLQVAQGSVVKFFLEPVAVSLNYLESSSGRDRFPHYVSYDMVGLSGGGWTTTVYSAIDARIEISVPVAGSVPLYMRNCTIARKAYGVSYAVPPKDCNFGFDGDFEQTAPAMYQVVGYLDLYALGADRMTRRQIQILNRHDPCCFGESLFAGPGPAGPGAWDKALRDYENALKAALLSTSAGRFDLVIDELVTQSPRHWISRWAVKNVILPALSRGSIPVGASEFGEHGRRLDSDGLRAGIETN